MNIIQLMDMAGFLNDRQRSARFEDDQYMKAINSAIGLILEDRLFNIKTQKSYSFESVQRVRDELYTLIPPTVVSVPVENVVSTPTDYNYYLRLVCTIDGVNTIARATSYNEYPLLNSNPFEKPKTTRPYFDQNSLGFNVVFGNSGNFTSAALDYVKNPAIVTIGKETDKIEAGTTLTIGISYIVYEEAVSNGITYVAGDIFTATVVTLDSGVVIPTSVIVNCDFPVKLHQEVARQSSAIMNSSVSDYDAKQSLLQDNNQA